MSKMNPDTAKAFAYLRKEIREEKARPLKSARQEAVRADYLGFVSRRIDVAILIAKGSLLRPENPDA